MILLVHMIFGAALGYKVYNVTHSTVLAIVVVLLGHYFLDLFPHIEYLESTESSIKKIKNGKIKDFLFDLLKVIIDFLLGILLIFLFSKNTPIIYIGALVATVPDGLTVITSLFPNKLLEKHHKIHGEKIHFLKYKKFSKFWRIFTQVFATIISIVLLIS